MSQLIYERLLDDGISAESALKLAIPPANADIPVWGIFYQNGWPDVSMFAGSEGMTWEQAYNRVLDLRSLMHVMAS
jgi:hypothetical protein